MRSVGVLAYTNTTDTDKDAEMNSTDQIIQDMATMRAFKEKLVARGEEYGKGLGEVYALGYLSSLVENLMAKYPEVRAEIQSALQQA